MSSRPGMEPTAL